MQLREDFAIVFVFVDSRVKNDQKSFDRAVKTQNWGNFSSVFMFTMTPLVVYQVLGSF